MDRKELIWKVNNLLFVKSQNNQVMKKNQFLSDLLGREVMEGEPLTAADNAVIESHLASQKQNTPPATPPESENPPPAVQSATAPGITQEQLTSALEKAIAPINSKLDSTIKRLEIVEGLEGSESTKTPPVSGDAVKYKSWEDPESKNNQALAKAMGE